MVHRSGSAHQCVELVENGVSNTKSKDDLDVTDSSKDSDSSSLGTDSESKRRSKRLCSVIPTDTMTPPKPFDINSVNKIQATTTITTIPSTTTTTASSSDTITSFVSNLNLSTVKPKPIRNRRYTINDCVRPNAKSSAVPFADQAKKSSDDISTIPKPIVSHDDLYNVKKDTLNCSVSLERLSGIVNTFSTRQSDLTDLDKDDVGTGGNKVLCLYCDRTFTSLNLYAKHVERIHQSKSGRRVSARTTSNATTSNYPGCSYCNVGKVTCLESEELSQLVNHLIVQHNDKYFACKECLIRFQTQDTLQNHLDIVHESVDTRPPRKKDATITARRSTVKNVQSLPNTSMAITPLSVQVDFDTNELDQTNLEPNLRNRLRRSNDLKTDTKSTDRPTRKPLLSSEETFLSRLGIGLNRSPRSRKGAKNRRGCSSELFSNENSRSTRASKNSKQSIINSESIDLLKLSSGKMEPVSAAFDEDFYESVVQNVKQNLTCHLDGKLESGPMSPSPLSPVANIPTVRSILVKSPLATEAEIHEATTISAFTAFPTLLTAQQYGGEYIATGKMKKPITKNSWKWKWDCVRKYKYVNEGGKIVKKIKQSTCGMRDLSTLDMWTQLTMRTRHESIQRQESVMSGEDSILGVGETAREEKRKLVEQLNRILDTRILPKINVEQNDQTIIKMELITSDSRRNEIAPASSQPPSHFLGDNEFPALINLIKRDRNPDGSQTSLILSGEWARPRCYICVGCGSLFPTIRILEEHKATKHPFVHSTHYEIVGKDLIDGDLFHNFFIPSMALQRHNEYNKKQFFNSICSVEDSMDSVTSYSMSLTKSDSFDLDSNSRNSKVSVSSEASISDRSFSASADEENANSSIEQSSMVEQNSICSKCNRKCKGMLDLYRHMLDCSSDYAWLLAKKRNNIKYRYFGVRRRRAQRSSSVTMRKMVRPKKERQRHNSDTSSQKAKEPTTPRQRPSDGKHLIFFSWNSLIALKIIFSIFFKLFQPSQYNEC